MKPNSIPVLAIRSNGPSDASSEAPGISVLSPCVAPTKPFPLFLNKEDEMCLETAWTNCSGISSFVARNKRTNQPENDANKCFAFSPQKRAKTTVATGCRDACVPVKSGV